MPREVVRENKRQNTANWHEAQRRLAAIGKAALEGRQLPLPHIDDAPRSSQAPAAVPIARAESHQHIDVGGVIGVALEALTLVQLIGWDVARSLAGRAR